MTKYRIKPKGAECWSVQWNVLGPFWTTERRTFVDEGQAEEFIRNRIADEAEDAKNRRRARRRKRNIPPRVYP